MTDFHLRAYQRSAVYVGVRLLQGLIVAPCGAGKTEIGCGIIREAGRSALVIVRTQDLAEQWRERISLRLHIEAGRLHGGHRDIKPVTIATLQTLASMGPDALSEIGPKFGVVILDEAHVAPAETAEMVMGHMPARWRIGLTATPERPDGLTDLLHWIMGPTLCTVSHEQLVDEGALVVPEVRRVDTGWAPSEEIEAAALEALDGALAAGADRAQAEKAANGARLLGVTRELVEDVGRNARIVSLAVSEARDGRRVLVLSGRVAHCDALAEAVGREGVEAASLTGRVAKRLRASTIDAFRAGGVQVLCATQLADEGLDVPDLDRVILAFPARSARQTVQRLGRLMRPSSKKAAPVLYDLVDEKVPLLLSQWRSRRTSFRRAGARVVG